MLAIRPPQPIEPAEAKSLWQNFRIANGGGPEAPLLSPPDANSKMNKSGRPDYCLSLSPARTSGHNVCPFSTPTCRGGCVAFSGRGLGPAAGGTVMSWRSLKVKFLVEDRDAFCTLVRKELELAARRHGKMAVRLNTFSDIPWEEVAPWMYDIPEVQVYDYTKWPDRKSTSKYHLTFSASDRTTDDQLVAKLTAGQNVAVVFDVLHRQNGDWQHELPAEFLGFPVIDGDKQDTRYDDPPGVVVGLRIKGRKLLADPGKFVRAA